MRAKSKAGTRRKKEFTIATFNVNSVRSRLDVVVPWLEEARPDVLCMQETKVVDADFPAASFEAAGYHVAFRGEKSYNGVAIASLLEPSSVSFGFDDGGSPEATRLACAEIAGVTVLDTYVPQGREVGTSHYAYKLDWLGRLGRWLDRRLEPGALIAWCGDINVAPAPEDVHDPRRLEGHVCFNPEVRGALAAIRDRGLVDVFRKHHPEPGQFTFFDYRVKGSLDRGVGWRVDHIHASDALAARSLDARIDLGPRRAARPSDHAPLLAVFGI